MSTQESVSREDLELIAAVLDGRLSGKARATALARIEADEAMREVFAESARFLAEDDEMTTVPTGRLFQPRFWKVAIPIAAAATLAAVLLGRPGDWQTRQASAYADRLAEAKVLPRGWYGSTDRGGGQTTSSFGLGIDLLQLQVALLKGDLETAQHRVGQIKHALDDDLPFAQGMGDKLGATCEAGPKFSVAACLRETRELDRSLTKDSRSKDPRIDPLYYALGKWAEAGRLAAKLEHLEVFDWTFRSVARKALKTPEPDKENPVLPKEVREPLGSIESILRGPLGKTELPKLEGAFDQLIQAASE